MTRKKANFLYTCINISHYLGYVIVFCYASAYMLNKGYTNTQIGFIMCVGNILTTTLLQVIARFERKYGINLCRFTMILAIMQCLAATALLVLPLTKGYVTVLMALIFCFDSLFTYYISTIYRGYHNRGIEMNYAVARGWGSMAYALSALMAGIVLTKLSTDLIPLFYLVPTFLLVIFLLVFNAPNVEPTEEEKVQNQKSDVSILKEYPHYILFSIAVCLLIIPFGFINTFMHQIIDNVNGSIDNVGVALFIGTAVELPAAYVYAKTSKKIGNRTLMSLSCWMQALKVVAILLAPNALVICIIQVTSILGYAMYLPSTAKHIAHALPPSLYVRGQALFGSATAMGYVIVTFFAGILMDGIGVTNTLIIMSVIAVIGSVLMEISVSQSYKFIPKSTK